jgi:dihydrofolate reductase
MEAKNKVFIATSLDRYIADKHGGLDWLFSVPNPEQNDMGYESFIQGIDAILMGRHTFETVCGFDCPWPYKKPVFVLSNTLKSIPQPYADKAKLIKGPLKNVVDQLNSEGYNQLYIDGGKVIQSFLKEDMVDELIITTIPVLLGGGASLFGKLSAPLNFELVSSKVFLDAVDQVHYKRQR